ncbi:MAG: SDR family NAD(P)-dependent oxidoreductase, partial [Myxococcota bacterium]
RAVDEGADGRCRRNIRQEPNFPACARIDDLFGGVGFGQVEHLSGNFDSEFIAEKIIDARAGREVGLLAYVAAAAPIGPFVDRARKDQLDALAVNCQTPTALLHALLPAMIARGRGGALLFSSMAGFQGSARIATYAATKAFDLVLAESLAAELRPKGIDIAAVCPGPTATPGYHRSKPQSRPAPVMQPDLVVAEALDLFGRRTVIVPGRFNRWSRRMLRWIGRQRAVELVSRATERMYPSSRTWPDEK